MRRPAGRPLGPWAAGLCFVLLSLGILVFTTALQAGSVLRTLGNYLRQPLLLGLNLLPIAAVLALLWGLLGNLFWAGSATSLLFHLLSLTNLIKIEGRKDPLVPADFGLITEALEATGEYRLNLHLPYLAVILAVAVLLALAGRRWRARPKPPVRALLAVAAAGLMTLGMCTFYPSKTLYSDLVRGVEGLTEGNVPKVFDETGFVYCFVHNLRLYQVERPEHYDRAQAAQWSRAPADAETPALLPDVIFIQCEAFSGLYHAPVFAYPEGQNPMAAYDRVCGSDRAVSGRIVVSNYGAGTANTEFDVLTGMQTNMLSATPSSAFRMVHKNTPTLARSFARLGYEGYFMHPGQRWFYNRESVYHYLGLDDQVFLDDFDNPYWKGSFVSDQSFLARLEQDYQAHLAQSEAPWFAFTVTIQNHQAYPWSKYSETLPPAPISVPVSDQTLEAASVYAQGIRDSAGMLEQLTQYLDGLDRPVLVVFWGDHLPALGSGFDVWRELGLDIGNESDLSWAMDTYTTPFVIWENRALAEALPLSPDRLELPADGRLSDIYLGQLVYELLGMEHDPYFNYLGQARRVLPVLNLGRYALPDGTLTTALTPAQQAVEEKLDCWEYYRITEPMED